MKTQNAFLRCLTFVAVLLTFLLAGSASYVQSAEEHPGMFMTSPNNAQINVEASTADVEIVITDPDGLKKGYDHRTDQLYDEFEASFGSAAERGFSWENEFNLKDGTYTIEIIGIETTWYSLGIALFRGRERVNPIFKAVVDKDKSAKYQFTFNSAPNKPVGSAVHLITPGSLKDDIIALRNHEKVGRGGIDNDGLMRSLLAKANAVEDSIAKGNKTAAINQLEAFINEVKAQNEKHIDEYGVKILIEDAEYLIKNLQ